MRKARKATVDQDGLLGCEDPTSYSRPVRVGSREWITWLDAHDGFIYTGCGGHFTARSELRRGLRYWYAYRRRDGKLSKYYLGKADEITKERLEQASASLAGLAFTTLLERNSNASIAQIPGAHAPIMYGDGENLPLVKFKPPELTSKLVPRPRLLERICAPVTLICAPSGYGKTTLINAWRQGSGKAVAWVTLDAEDNDPQRFWASVVAALRTLEPGFGQSVLARLHSPSVPALITTPVQLTNALIRLIDQRGGQSQCLILDDFHHIQHAEVVASLRAWLEQIPAGFQLIVSSDAKVPLMLGTLIARGTLVELTADDLRFTLDEGEAFFKSQPTGQPLLQSEAHTIIRRTEGWAAGLMLAASVLAQQKQAQNVADVFSGVHDYLREFFTESILRRQPEEIKHFLLKTSILSQLTGRLCNALTGRSDGDETLARLWCESLFLERMDESGRYRYHEMFAETLKNQLEEQFPAEITRLHRKAARWYRAHAMPGEAINHLLAGKAWEKAATLIESVALNELASKGDDSLLLRWLQKLPEAVLFQHRNLMVVYIRLSRLWLPAKTSDELISRAETRIKALPTAQRSAAMQETLAEIQGIRRLWVADGQPVIMARIIKEPDSVGQLLEGILKCHRDCRINLVKAEASANEVFDSAMAKNHLYSIVVAGGEWANLAFSQGHLRRSAQIAYRVLQKATELHETLPERAGIALTTLSGVYFERNQVDQAEQMLDRALEVRSEPLNTNESISLAILRAKIQSTQGNGDGAFDTLQKIRESYYHHPSHIWLDQDLIAYQALFRLHQGDISSAERHLGGGWDPNQNPFSAFIHASILIEQERNLAAEEILRHLVERFPNSFYWMPILRVQIKLALALFNQQKINQASHVMAEAARLAAPEYFVRPFLFSESPIPSLLSLVLNTEDINPGTRSFIKGTLMTMTQDDRLFGFSSRDETWPLSIAAAISPREQEILQSLSIGLSNQDIAQKLYISESTVKTHLHNIYEKLGVHNRTQAIARARVVLLSNEQDRMP